VVIGRWDTVLVAMMVICDQQGTKCVKVQFRTFTAKQGQAPAAVLTSPVSRFTRWGQLNEGLEPASVLTDLIQETDITPCCSPTLESL